MPRRQPSSHPCVLCSKNVRDRQEFFTCTNCGARQHRTCTDMTQEAYREQVKEGNLIMWSCIRCPPVIEQLLANQNCSNNAESSITSSIGMPIAESTANNGEDISQQVHNQQESLVIPPVNPPVIPSVNLPVNPPVNPPVNNALQQPQDVSQQIPIQEPQAMDIDFDISRPFEHHEHLEEDTIMDNSLPNNVSLDSDSPVTYEVIPNGSKKGKPLLTESTGYIYNIKIQTTKRIVWRCNVRGKALKCPATVTEYDEHFIRGPQAHIHNSKPGLSNKVKMAVKVKAVAREDIFRSSSGIVEEAILESQSTNNPLPTSLKRTVNRTRQMLRPDEPKDLNFNIDHDFIPPDFLQDDIVMEDGARHLLFATPKQIELLSNAKTWYLDGTFKIVAEPFAQLFSIHCFLKGSDGNIKQVPLLFCLMSRRRRRDYKQVLQAVRRHLEGNFVQKMVLDFEKAAWTAILSSGFDDSIQIQGCCFHWTQAVWRRVQGCGLQTAFMEDPAVQNYVKQLLALPFLPSDHIEDAFGKLAEKASPQLLPVVEYIRTNWIESEMWGPSSWSIFDQPIRTNNDVEGWHRRLNSKAGRGNMSMYMLIMILFREAQMVHVQGQLVRDGKLSRYQRKSYTTMQGRIQNLWKQYKEDELTTSKLLRSCSKLVNPTV